MVRFMVAIARNKVVIKCHQYFGPANSETFKSFIDDEFSKGKLFLKKSKFAYEAMESVSCRLFKTPPRFPDLNPIENIFNLILENN